MPPEVNHQRSWHPGRASIMRRGTLPRCWVGVVLVLLAGCREERGVQRVFDRVANSLQADDRDAGLKVARRSCTHLASITGILIHVSSILPAEFRSPGQVQPQDSGWLPVNLTEVVPFGEELAVLDGGASQVTIFSGDLRTRRTVGREGGGPAEFRHPVALGADPKTGQLVVVDEGNGRLVFLGADGHPIETWIAPNRTSEDALLSGGEVLISHYIIPEMLGRDSTLGQVLTMQRGGTQEASALVTVRPSTLDGRRFPLPGPNRFRLGRSSAYRVLFSPASGDIEVLVGATTVGHLSTCVPPALSDAYDRQRAAHASGARGNSQQWYPLLTDVLIQGDTVYAVGPMPDQAGRFHIDRYNLDGTDLGSLVAPVDSLSFPQELRFWTGPTDLIAFGRHGTILRLRFRQDS